MTKQKTYKAQALAIVMVILVVASIIGFSVFSRLMTQKRAVVQERESSEALEVTDIILDNMLLSRPEEWISAGMPGKTYTETFYQTQNTIPGQPGNPLFQLINKADAAGIDMEIQKTGDIGSNEISKLSAVLGHEINLQALDICPLAENNNVYTLSLKRTDEGTLFALRPGETFVFPIAGKNFGPACSINISFPNPPTLGGFVVNKIFKEGTDIKAYDYLDTENFCFSNNGSSCSNPQFNDAIKGWRYHQTDPLNIPINPNLERIQLTAVHQDLSFKFSMSKCNEKIELWQLRASATCNGTYRAKEVIVPDVGWSYSIFNYVFFNGLGNL